MYCTFSWRSNGWKGSDIQECGLAEEKNAAMICLLADGQIASLFVLSFLISYEVFYVVIDRTVK